MQPRAYFGINQSKLKIMNKKYRNRSSSKAISLSFPRVSLFFLKKDGFFMLFLGEAADWFAFWFF